MIMNFEKDILWVLEDSTPESPKELGELIAAIDIQQRVLITYDELITTLKKMVLEGKIKETKPMYYYKPQENNTGGIFSEISKFEYEKAVEKYKEWLNQEDNSDNIIVVEWNSEKKIDKEIFDIFRRELVSDIDKELINYPHIVQGYDNGEYFITCWIVSTKNIDAHEIYEVILPQLKKYIHKYGGNIEATVGGEEDDKKVYSIKN